MKKRLRGKIGTAVALRVQRPGDQGPRDVTIVREHIHDNSVRGPAILDAERGIGYVHVRGFNENTPRDFDAAASWLLKRGMKAMILDLRFNPGGLLKSATDLADRFLAAGVIVTTKGRDPASRLEYDASGKPTIPADVTVILLVNGESASASEVVAGALQDHRRALLVGSRTFGKGVVQTTVPFDGDRALVKLTTARYYTPSGRCIEKLVGVDSDRVGSGGILPDVEVTLNDAETHAAAVRIGRLRALEDVLGSGSDSRDTQRVADREIEQALALLRGEPATQALVASSPDAKAKSSVSDDDQGGEDDH
ncbi:MAG: hypothetical protein HY292_16300 [Planctomycetes bacterium]|nr:hypothetical protein [Planctomycetota bacterium]